MEQKDVITAIVEANSIIQSYTKHTKLDFITPVLPPHGLSDAWEANAFGLIKEIGDVTKTAIEIQRVDTLELLIGYFLKYQSGETNTARIVYASRLNLCWSRLIVSKEAMHLLLGHPSNATHDFTDTVSLVTKLLNPSMFVPNNNNHALAVEYSAVFGAIELLIPFQKQKVIREYQEYGKTNLDIAKAFKVPEGIIEMRYSDLIKPIYDQAYSDIGLI